MRYKTTLTIAFLFFLLGTFSVHAQSAGIVPDPVQYSVTPEAPGPNQFVNIQVAGVGMFLGNAKITWQQDGKNVSSADNQETFSFTTGGIGTLTRIHLIINSPTQGTITHDFVFNPSVINLVWEADTYTPLLYRGKALYSAGSGLRVVAFPTVVLNRTIVPSSALSFQWYRDDSPVTSASGLGKNSYSFQGDQLQTGEDIAVNVYSGNTEVGRGELTIPAVTPQILVYNDDPLRGELLDQGMTTSVSLTGQEITLKAEPYFFSNQAKGNNNLVYAWELDNQDATGPSSAQGILTLRQTGSGGGSSDLSVSVQNTNSMQFAQAASTQLQIIFGQQSGSSLSSFFGL